MPRKVYVKPPPVVRTQFVALIVISVLFLLVFLRINDTGDGHFRRSN